MTKIEILRELVDVLYDVYKEARFEDRDVGIFKAAWTDWFDAEVQDEDGEVRALETSTKADFIENFRILTRNL
jgi:hypothetical protein